MAERIFTGKNIGRALVLGGGIVLLTQFVSPFVPDIFRLGITSVGILLTAGASALVVEQIVKQFKL